MHDWLHSWKAVFFLAALACRIASAPAEEGDGEGVFDGLWRTSIGTVTLKQKGNEVTGTYGNAGQFTLKGTVEGRKLTFEYQEGQASGDAQWTLDESGHSFDGGYKIRGGRAGGWQGWRPDPTAPKGERSISAACGSRTSA
jgi:hypothetical protein